MVDRINDGGPAMTDYHLAIWELLTPEERPKGLSVTMHREWPEDVDHWYLGDHVIIRESFAHRAILDAGREVLDGNAIVIYPKSSDRWVWDNEEYGSPPYPTRTECIYHALKWLREEWK
jgi:hypothetical protein